MGTKCEMVIRETKRVQCKECPWRENSSRGDKKFLSQVTQMRTKGVIKKTHRCHMISTDLWKPADETNVCVGSKNS
jgi:hypothetical protein